MKARNMRIAYDALEELLKKEIDAEMAMIQSDRQRWHETNRHDQAIVDELGNDTDYFIVPLNFTSFLLESNEKHLPPMGNSLSREEELDYIWSILVRPKAKRIDQSYKLDLPERDCWKVVKWTKTISSTEVWIRKSDYYGEYVTVIKTCDPTV